MPNKFDSLKTIEGLLDIVVQKYSNIQLRYKSAGIIEKRKLIGSMYPKNLCFDGNEHRPLITANRSHRLTVNYKAKRKKKSHLSITFPLG